MTSLLIFQSTPLQLQSVQNGQQESHIDRTGNMERDITNRRSVHQTQHSCV